LNRFKKILVAIYIHPEYYPPTLNAITEFAKYADSVIVVTRNLVDPEWNFPANTILKLSGTRTSLQDTMRQSFWKKMWSFYQYFKLLYRSMKSERPDVVVVYDVMALLVYRLVRIMVFHRHLFWYHNHDVNEGMAGIKLSIGWCAAKLEPHAFKVIDIFTLPSEDRKSSFPLKKLKGKYFFLPNWPLISFYKQFYIKKQTPQHEIKLLYQGVICDGHGLENIIEILNNKIGYKSLSLSLTLIGVKSDAYKQKLIKIAEKYNALDKVRFLPRENYAKLGYVTRAYDIGLAMLEAKGENYSTGGTTSNKIYEYAALGLPVILYDDQQYRKYLGNCQWASFANLTSNALLRSIEETIDNYEEKSKAAHRDFLDHFNFENHFSKTMDKIIEEYKILSAS